MRLTRASKISQMSQNFKHSDARNNVLQIHEHMASHLTSSRPIFFMYEYSV